VLQEHLSDTIFNKVILKDQVGSTNDLAMELLGSDEQSGVVVIADAQTSGRGRLGRTWYSPRGKNIYMSLALRPGMKVQDGPILTVLAAVAVCRGLESSAGIDVAIKWPNDLVLHKKKLGGILIENRVEKEHIAEAVIGIGININIDKKEFPVDIQDIATSLYIETGSNYKREEIAVSIIKAFDLFYRELTEVGNMEYTGLRRSTWRELIRQWKERDITLGKRVSVVTSDETIDGKAIDIDDMCRLRIVTGDGDEKLIHSGDVTLIL
jgi:BirA family biotin operon repressor/biotin-[acetyl-CoA-carboxylase] ligase